MWATTLQQYCSGPVDGNLYAIVRRGADGSWIEESSGGDDSGCGASSNVGYKPSTPSAEPAAVSSTADRQGSSAGGIQDIDSLLDDLLGVGASAGPEKLPPPASPPPPPPPPPPLPPQPPPPPPRTNRPAATERERQLAAELRRTKRQLHRRQRKLRHRSASESGSWDGTDTDDEVDGEPVTWRHSQHQPDNQHHLRQQSFRSDVAPHHAIRHRNSQNHESYENYRSTKHHSLLRSYPREAGLENGNRQSTASYYSTADGDIQYRSDRVGQIDPRVLSQPPVWEKRYHAAVQPSRDPESGRSNERFGNHSSQQRGGTLSQRQSRGDPEGILEASRDLLEARLQELREQMNSAREKLLTAKRVNHRPGDSSSHVTPHQSSANQELARNAPATAQQLPATPQQLVEAYKETETVFMQLIGRGIHDLSSKSSTVPRPVRNQFTRHPAPMDATEGGSASTTPTATNQRRAVGQHSTLHNPQPISIDYHSQHQQPPLNGSAHAQQPPRVPSSPEAASSGLSSSVFHSPSASALSIDAAKDTMHLWYRPAISREEAINLLRNAASGSFLVRDSNSYPGAFGLALRTAADNQKAGGAADQPAVRHFLVEPAAGGVRLRGCVSEPTFSSLAALVWQHSLAPMALPCRLLLPSFQRQAASAADASDSAGVYDHPDKIAAAAAATSAALGMSPASASSCLQRVTVTTFSVVYIGTANVESLTGGEAVSRAVNALLSNGRDPQQPLVTAECQLRVSPAEGLTLTDQQRRLFFRKHYPLSVVLHCGLDGASRCLSFGKLQSPQDAQAARLFGLVTRGNNGGNTCTVLCERDPLQPAPVVVSLVNQVLIGTR